MHVLIIDDEQEFASSLAEYLSSFKFTVSVLTETDQWEKEISHEFYDLILLDIRMPTVNGLDILHTIRMKGWDTPVIMISGYASVENIVKAMKFGAHNFYEKPIKLKELVRDIQHTIKTRSISARSTPGKHITTCSPKMHEIMRMVEKSANTMAPVLITGESGTGKELIVNYLHRLSILHNGPMVRLNCAAIPENLVESEFFGHEAGAFTDAKQSKPGKFEQAHGGTIFFDELTEMNIGIQAKLLRIIQDGDFERLGGSKHIHADVRIVSATNQNIQQAVAEHQFREDLYYRLSVIMIHLPPLRERREDIPLLLKHFMEQFSVLYQRRVTKISAEVQSFFQNHTWTGNVRELKNTIERAVIFCEDETIEMEHLPAQYQSIQSQAIPQQFETSLPYEELDKARKDLSRKAIFAALRKANGRKQVAARILNVHRKTLYNQMKRLGIQT